MCASITIVCCGHPYSPIWAYPTLVWCGERLIRALLALPGNNVSGFTFVYQLSLYRDVIKWREWGPVKCTTEISLGPCNHFSFVLLLKSVLNCVIGINFQFLDSGKTVIIFGDFLGW